MSLTNTTGQPGANTRLFKGNGSSPEALTFIANVTSLEVDPKTSFKKTTAHGATVGAGNPVPETQIPTTISYAVKATLEFISDNAQHAALLADEIAGTLDYFAISFPDTAKTAFAFTAYVGSVSLKAPATGTLTADVTLEVTGQLSVSTAFPS